jgi:hypothetical protein
VKGNFHARFWIGGGESNLSADHKFASPKEESLYALCPAISHINLLLLFPRLDAFEKNVSQVAAYPQHRRANSSMQKNSAQVAA